MNTFTTSIPGQLEFAEAQYWLAYYGKNPHTKSNFSIIGGAAAFSAPSIPVLAMNRVLGLGLNIPVSSEILQEIITFYQSSGTNRFMLQMHPVVLAETSFNLLREAGFSQHTSWAKLTKSLTPVEAPIEPGLQVRQLGLSEARRFGDMVAECFNWDHEGLPNWLAASVESPHYVHYAVEKDSQVISVGALHMANGIASLAFAATLPAYRGLGAQGLLMRQRLHDAWKAGCTIAQIETAAPGHNGPGASYRNAIRHGFEVAYVRPNWLWEQA